MAAKIKYVGFSHFRELLEKDFARLGVEGQEALSFARHEVVEVSDDVAKVLVETLGDEFEKVEEDVKAVKASKRQPVQGSNDASGPA